jgi:hypothetical protein
MQRSATLGWPARLGSAGERCALGVTGLGLLAAAGVYGTSRTILAIHNLQHQVWPAETLGVGGEGGRDVQLARGDVGV